MGHGAQYFTLSCFMCPLPGEGIRAEEDLYSTTEYSLPLTSFHSLPPAKDRAFSGQGELLPILYFKERCLLCNGVIRQI